MRVAVLVAPEFDSATEYSYDWSREAKALLEEKGYKIIDIGGRRVSRAEVEEALKRNSDALYIHMNHGSEDVHWGSEDEAVIDLENVELLYGRETYCMNCLSAKKLGVEAWKGKALAYWGYIEVFTFTTEAIDEFKEFAVSGLRFRLEGKSWKECLQLAKDLAKALAQKLVEAGKYIASVILQGDADALRCYTEDMPPTSDCTFRNVAIKLLGPKIGWKLTKAFPISVATFFVGLGILLHDYCHALWQVGGISEILSLQGGYFGIAILAVGFILAYYQVWSALTK